MSGIWESVNLVFGDRFKMVVESGLKRIGVQGGMDRGPYKICVSNNIFKSVTRDNRWLIVGRLTVIIIYVATSNYYFDQTVGLLGHCHTRAFSLCRW